MMMAQFMLAGSGFGAGGKKRKMNATARKQIAVMLIGIPKAPRLNLDAGNLSPRRSRLASIVQITTIYDVNSPVVPTDRIILNAAVEPISISDSRLVTVRVRYTELVGTPFDRTWERN